MARHDETVELKAAPVTVTRAVVTAFDDDTASVSLTCSAGFYVRSFAHELGRRLGCGACLEALRRTRSGTSTLSGATTMEELGAAGAAEALVCRLVPCNALLPDFPMVQLNEQGLGYVSNGRDLGAAQLARPVTFSAGTAWVGLVDTGGSLVALATPDAASGT